MTLSIGTARWREMEAADLDGVVGIARLAFPDHFEDRSCFAERLRLYPRGCFALEADRGAIVGYLIAYPWIRDSVPALDSLIHMLPAEAETLYLHDLALHPDARGQGFARPIVDALVALARQDGWPAIALVAVNQAHGFWSRLGFEMSESRTMASKLASYGAGAHYMVRKL